MPSYLVIVWTIVSAVVFTSSSASSSSLLHGITGITTQTTIRPKDKELIGHNINPNEEEIIYITKRDGTLEQLDGNKVRIFFGVIPVHRPVCSKQIRGYALQDSK